MDDTLIYYRGFTPAEVTKQAFQKLIRKIQDDAPTSSFIRASIAHDGGFYRGAVKINSMIGHFHGYAQTQDVQSLGDELYENLCLQLNQWKATRFASDGGVQSMQGETYDEVLS